MYFRLVESQVLSTQGQPDVYLHRHTPPYDEAKVRPVPESVRRSFPWIAVDENFDWTGYMGGKVKCTVDLVHYGVVVNRPRILRRHGTWYTMVSWLTAHVIQSTVIPGVPAHPHRIHHPRHLWLSQIYIHCI